MLETKQIAAAPELLLALRRIQAWAADPIAAAASDNQHRAYLPSDPDRQRLYASGVIQEIATNALAEVEARAIQLGWGPKGRRPIHGEPVVGSLWLVHMFGDVEPLQHGPFATELERDQKAWDVMHDEDAQESHDLMDGVYWLNVTKGVPEIGSYSGGFRDSERPL